MVCPCEKEHARYPDNPISSTIIAGIREKSEQFNSYAGAIVTHYNAVKTVYKEFQTRKTSSNADIFALESESQSRFQLIEQRFTQWKTEMDSLDPEAIINLWKTGGYDEDEARSYMTCTAQGILEQYNHTVCSTHIDRKKLGIAILAADAKLKIDYETVPYDHLQMYEERLADWKASFAEIDIEQVTKEWAALRASGKGLGQKHLCLVARRAIFYYEEGLAQLYDRMLKGGPLVGVPTEEQKPRILAAVEILSWLEDCVDKLDPEHARLPALVFQPYTFPESYEFTDQRRGYKTKFSNLQGPEKEGCAPQ